MNLELAILNTLAASPKALPAPVILGFVGSFTGGTETLHDVQLGLKRLEAKGHVKGTADEDRGPLWKETAEGRLRIA